MIRHLDHDENCRIHLIEDSEHGEHLVGGIIQNSIDALFEVVVRFFDSPKSGELGHRSLRDNTDFCEEAHEIVTVAALDLRDDTNIGLSFLQHQFALELKNIRLLVLIQQIFI